MENWKDIAGFEGRYQVSDKGNVRRIKLDGSTRELKHSIWGRYYTVSLCDKRNGNHRREYIHRLVAMHFVPNPRMVDFVNHKDGNPLNNDAENLEWVTNHENLIHACTELGKAPFGCKAKPISQYDMEGNLIATYRSIGEACQALNIANSRSHVSNCANGRITSAYGYRWKFAE